MVGGIWRIKPKIMSLAKIKKELILNSLAFDVLVNDMSSYDGLKSCQEYLNIQYDLLKQVSKEIDYLDDKIRTYALGSTNPEDLIERFDEIMDYKNLKKMIWRAKPEIRQIGQSGYYELYMRFGYEIS
jgi:hypothetical protein